MPAEDTAPAYTSEIDILADRGTDAPNEAPVDDTPVDTGADETIDTEEQPAEDEAATEEEAPSEEEEAPADEEAPAEDETVEEETPVDEDVEAPDSETLSELYTDYPAVKSFLKEHPEVRPAFFRAAEINKIYGTVEDARMAREWSRDLYKFEQLFTGSRDDKRTFLQSLWDNNLDANGNSEGHYEQIAELMVGDTLANLDQRITGPDAVQLAQSVGLKNPAQLQVAIESVRRLLGVLGGGETSRPGAGDARAAQPSFGGAQTFDQRLAAREAKVAEAEQRLTSQRQETFNSGVRQNFRSWLDGAIDKQLKASTGLQAVAKKTPGVLAMVQETIARKTAETIHQDEFFTNRIDAMVRGKQLDESLAQEVARAITDRARVILPRVTSSVLRDIGVQLSERSSAARDLARSGGRRREPQTAGTAGRLTRAPGIAAARKPKEGETYDQYANRLLNEE